MTKLLKIFLFLALVLPGCSTKEEEKSLRPDDFGPGGTLPVAGKTDPKQGIAPMPEDHVSDAAKQMPGILIQWQVPDELIESYDIYYGEKKDALNKHATIPVTQLEKIQHPSLGKVYRYFINGAPRDKVVYISLRAKNKHGLSDFSEPIPIIPGKW